MKTIRIIPDSRLQNVSVETLAASLYELGTPLYKRIHRDGMKLQYEPQVTTVWEWHLAEGKAELYVHMSDDSKTSVEQHLQTCWKRSTIEKPEHDPLNDWNGNIVGADIMLREHYFYSITVDRRSLAPISSMFETLRLLKANERGLVQMIFTPASVDWNRGAEAAYEKLKHGEKPKRRKFSASGAVEFFAKTGATIALHASALVAELITGDEIEPEPIEQTSRLLDDRRPSHYTMQKAKHQAFDVTIRVAAMSKDPERRNVILRSLGSSFRDLDGDNGFTHNPVQNMRHWWKSVVERRAPINKLNPDYLSLPEASRLMQLPTGSLQEEYGIESVKHRETDISDVLTKDGIELGSYTFRGKNERVFMPVTEKYWNDLCLGRSVIGGMGTGKTKGFGGNWGAQCLKYGFSVISIDVAKDELGDEIRIGAKKLGIDPSKLVRYQFGQNAYRLDWCESENVKNAANRLAGEAVNFFKLRGAEAGVETARYIRLAGKTVGVIRGSLADMVRLFTDPEYRKEIMLKLDSRPDLLQEWRTFEKLSDGMKGKVMDPVLNRLDMLLGDDYLRECMEASNGIDFRQYLTGGYHVSLHIPKYELGAEAVDILVDFLMSKIELAMYARPESEQVPCFVICDEPHQFPSCAPRWERMAVECRKWRLGLIWMFHSFEQIPKSLAHRMKDAGMHYHLYTSSKNTYKSLAEEIMPFEIEEALKTPKHHAINIIKAGDEYLPPFMMKMSEPPSMWK